MNPIPIHFRASLRGFFCGGSFQPGKFFSEGSILAQQLFLFLIERLFFSVELAVF